MLCPLVYIVFGTKVIDWMNPQLNTNLIDVAAGTGDIARLFSKKTNNSNITCIEPNKEMFNEGRNSLKKYKNIRWINSKAEKLPLESNSFDFYSISFGIRNVSDINLSLKEAFRVLRPGGRFMCLEFSKIENEMLNDIYKRYSKSIPYIGKWIVGSEKPYNYLIESIENFYNQEKLVEIINKNGFSNVQFRNLSGGIAAIHSGWKI